MIATEIKMHFKNASKEEIDKLKKKGAAIMSKKQPKSEHDMTAEFFRGTAVIPVNKETKEIISAFI